jgi:hypothetical protein
MVVVFGALFATETRSMRALVLYTVLFALAGAVLSLIGTIAWMVWYERFTGYSAGNAPLGWIFVYGPASTAIGELVGFAIWRLRPASTAVNRTR